MKVIPLSESEQVLLKAAYVALVDAEVSVMRARETLLEADSAYQDILKNLADTYELAYAVASDNHVFIYGKPSQPSSSD